MEKHYFNRFVLNMVQGHHLQLRPCPPLFCNFWQFNVKVAAAHHPIIQKVVDWLLSKGAIEPSSGGAASFPVCLLFLNILVSSGPYLTLISLIIICIYLPLRCLLSDMSSSLFSVVIMLFPLISRMPIYIFLLLSIMINFYDLFGRIHQWKVLPFGRATGLGFSQPSLNLSCSFTITRVSILLSFWMTSYSWFTLSGQVRGLAHF